MKGSPASIFTSVIYSALLSNFIASSAVSCHQEAALWSEGSAFLLLAVLGERLINKLTRVGMVTAGDYLYLQNAVLSPSHSGLGTEPEPSHVLAGICP